LIWETGACVGVLAAELVGGLMAASTGRVRNPTLAANAPKMINAKTARWLPYWENQVLMVDFPPRLPFSGEA
jgi:hypothetical protein